MILLVTLVTVCGYIGYSGSHDTGHIVYITGTSYSNDTVNITVKDIMVIVLILNTVYTGDTGCTGDP